VRGSWRGMDPVIPCGAGAQQGWKDRDLGGAWIRSGAGARHGPRGWDPSGKWIQHIVGVWHGLRGGEPGGAEQEISRLMGWGLVLLVDCGIEKPSVI
jgi:hypothetical protein